jgi:hypothetical protein
MFARYPNRISACTTWLSTVFGNFGASLRVFTVWNTPSTSCVLSVVWKIILEDLSSMPTWSVTQAAIRPLCFLGNDCAWDSQSIANLFAEFIQSVYLRDDWIPDGDLPTPGNGHKMSAIEVSELRFSGLRRQQGTRPGRNYTSYFETVSFGCQSSFDIRF